MKHFLAILLTTTLFGCHAYAADEIVRSDKLKLGRGVSSADKTIEIDTNSGANNPKIEVTPAQNDLRLKSSKVKVGDNTAADQTLTFRQGSGTPPAIKWNNTTAKLEFTNDGTNFKGIGSGSGGGGSGLNLIENSGFEDGVLGFTSSGGVTTVETAGANLLAGLKSVTFDASAGAQYFESNVIAIPEYLKGRNCLARIHYKGADANLKFQVLDGSNVAIAPENIFSEQTNVMPMLQSFICPTSGSMKWRVLSTASAAPLSMDQVHIGENDMLVQLSQAVHVGTLKYAAAANCQWAKTSNFGVFSDLDVDTDCATPTVSGSLTAPATKIAGFKMDVTSGSIYRITLKGGFTNGNGSNLTAWRMSDGTDNTDVCVSVKANAGLDIGFNSVASCLYKPTSSGLKTIQLQSNQTTTEAGTVIANYDSAADGFVIEVEQFPSQSQLAINSTNSNSGLVSWTPTITGVTASNVDVKWSRRGDKMYIVGKFDHTGGTAITMTLPNGVTVDSTKISATNYHTVGTGSISSANYTLTVLAQGGLQTLSFGLNGVATSGNSPFNAWPSETMQFSAEFPITGWTESQLNMPVLVGGVSTGSSGAIRIESAQITSTGVVSNETSDFLNGNCTNATPTVCTFSSGIWSNNPNCQITRGSIAPANDTPGISSLSSTSLSYSFHRTGTGEVQGDAVIFCIGPK